MIAQIVAPRCEDTRAVAGRGTGSRRRTGGRARGRARPLTMRTGSAWAWSPAREDRQHAVLGWEFIWKI
jgi:hypothetical protein